MSEQQRIDIVRKAKHDAREARPIEKRHVEALEEIADHLENIVMALKVLPGSLAPYLIHRT